MPRVRPVCADFQAGNDPLCTRMRSMLPRDSRPETEGAPVQAVRVKPSAGLYTGDPFLTISNQGVAIYRLITVHSRRILTIVLTAGIMQEIEGNGGVALCIALWAGPGAALKAPDQRLLRSF